MTHPGWARWRLIGFGMCALTHGIKSCGADMLGSHGTYFMPEPHGNDFMPGAAWQRLGTRQHQPDKTAGFRLARGRIPFPMCFDQGFQPMVMQPLTLHSIAITSAATAASTGVSKAPRRQSKAAVPTSQCPSTVTQAHHPPLPASRLTHLHMDFCSEHRDLCPEHRDLCPEHRVFLCCKRAYSRAAKAYKKGGVVRALWGTLRATAGCAALFEAADRVGRGHYIDDAQDGLRGSGFLIAFLRRLHHVACQRFQ